MYELLVEQLLTFEHITTILTILFDLILKEYNALLSSIFLIKLYIFSIIANILIKLV